MTEIEMHKIITAKLGRIKSYIKASHPVPSPGVQHAYRVIESRIRMFDRLLTVVTVNPEDPEYTRAKSELRLTPGDNGTLMEWDGRKHRQGSLLCNACLWTPRRYSNRPPDPRVQCCEICVVCSNGVTHVVERDIEASHEGFKQGFGGFIRDYSGLPPTQGVTNSPGTSNHGLTQAVIPVKTVLLVKTRCDSCGIEYWGEIQYAQEG